MKPVFKDDTEVCDMYQNNHTHKRRNWTELLLILEDSEQQSKMKTTKITTEKLRKSYYMQIREWLYTPKS
ncbi:hypothetical protein QL285_043055 [Trifolium repens]|nr:hypothetical protein QL285_043055 [Trifolium repens]